MIIPEKAGFCLLCCGISDELDIDKDETGETVMFCQKCGSEYVTFLSKFIDNFYIYFPQEIELRTEVWSYINRYLALLNRCVPCKYCGHEKTILAHATAGPFVPNDCPYQDGEPIEMDNIEIEATCFIQYCEKCKQISNSWADLIEPANELPPDSDEPLDFEAIKAKIKKPVKYYGYDAVFGESDDTI